MASRKLYHLADCHIGVTFAEKLISISPTNELKRYLSKEIFSRSSEFASLVKADYLLLFQEPLKISDRSLIIEIWGHLFAEDFAAKIKALLNFKPVTRIADFVIRRSETIECGEKSVDSNRIFWDCLTPFYQPIRWLTPNRFKK